MATSVVLINARYQVSGKPIGQGGMGVVYRAYDIVTKRHVALKTLRGPLNSLALDLFSKEWTVLARISHPNIVDILDTGELDDGGERKPFFVMPFLQGATLDELIRKSSQRLTVERLIGIASQACRGLHAAHEQGLIHRDLKPSNIFVMEDDTAKIIDFGVVHLVGADSVTGLKGTVQYMAPEQIEMKAISPASDVFALSVVCYEALTGRKPFARRTDSETAEAIRRHIPPPVCELNPLVSQMVSRVIHKGMAKDPWHRFSTAREYADTLQKALNNQPIERFERGKIQPRIERAKRAQAEGDLQFASEILTELEAEGNIDPEMTMLRIQIDHAIRQKSVRQLLDTARTRLEEDEFPLALQKIQEVLEIDPDNADALGLRTTIEKQRSEHQIENWLRLVEQHVHNHAFPQARQALQEILKISPAHARARDLLLVVGRREEEIQRLWKEKEQLYQAALSAYQHGEISSALTKLERVLDLNRQSPDSALPDRDAQYQNFYNQIRTEREAARNSYAEGRRHMVDRNFAKALEVCAAYLKKFPADPMFQALQLEIEEQQRQEQSAFIAEVSRRADAEPDLDRRVNILKEAAERYPDEAHFQQSLRLIRERRDLVNSIVAKARQYEERAQFSEALGQWDILRNIYAQYPGIDFEVERLKRRRNDQVRDEAKARWVDQIDRHISAADYTRARDLALGALAEFPGDQEIEGLGRLAQQAIENSAEAEVWLQRGQQLCFDRRYGEGLDALRKAASLDNRNAVIRAALLNALVEQARSVLGQDWRAAEPLIQQALTIDGGHPLARSLQGLVQDYKHQEIVNECISQARQLQAGGDLAGAVARIDEVLRDYPNEVRLVQLRSTLRNLAGDSPAHSAPAPNGGSTIPLVTAGESPAPPVASDPPPAAHENAAGESVVTIPRPMPVPSGGANDGPRQASDRAAESPIQVAGRGVRKTLAWFQAAGVARGHFSPLQWFMFALVPVILLSAYAVTESHRVKPKSSAGPAPRQYSVDVAGDVPGAAVTRIVNGRSAGAFPATLPAGRYEAAVSLPGYTSGPYPFSVDEGGATSGLPLHLQPAPVRIQVSWDLKAGQVSVDDAPPQELQQSVFTTDVSAGTSHKLTLFAAKKEALSFSFNANPGQAPTIIPPIKSQDLDAVAIASLAGRATVYGTNGALKGEIKDRPPRPVPPAGLELGDVPPQAEFVSVDAKGARSPLTFESGNAPVLMIVATSDPTSALLMVDCTPADAVVTIAGRRLNTSNGAAQRRLPPGTYTIEATRDGYSPDTQTVELKKAASVPVHFVLKPLAAAPASLAIDGTPPGAELWMDGVRIGQTDATGHFQTDNLAAGAHSLILKKQYFEDKELEPKTLNAGQTLRIPDAAMIPWGMIAFDVPDGATLKWKDLSPAAKWEPADKRTPVHVKAGNYQVSGAMAGAPSNEQTVEVAPGKTATYSWTPIVVKQPAAAPPPPLLSREEWTTKGPWQVHNGSGTTWLSSNQGTFTLTVLRPKSGTLSFLTGKPVAADWVIDDRGDGSRIEYSVDSGGDLERRVFVNGVQKEKAPIKLKPAKNDASFTLRITIGKDRVLVSGGGNKTDDYRRPNAAEPLGKFGFKGETSIRIVQEK